MKLVLVLVLVGCVDMTDHQTPWQDASTITGTLAPEFGVTPAPLSSTCTLRIATWNLHFAPDPADLAARIQTSDLASADVILTQEVDAYPDEPSSRASRLAAALGMTYVFAPATTVGEHTHGLAIFSRYPLTAPAIRELPFFDNALNPERRIALRADVDLGDELLRIVDVHLDTRMAPADRIFQLHPAVNDSGDRLIAGGDFNTLPWSWAGGTVPVTSTEAVTGQQQAAVVDDYMLGNAFTRALTPDSPTFPVPLFSMRLDNLYARGPAITAAAVAPVDGSDHRPVWVDVDRCVSRP